VPKRDRNHRRTLSGASLPGRGSDGERAVKGWWSGQGSAAGSVGGSRPTTPKPGQARGYEAIEQTDEEEARR